MHYVSWCGQPSVVERAVETQFLVKLSSGNSLNPPTHADIHEEGEGPMEEQKQGRKATKIVAIIGILLLTIAVIGFVSVRYLPSRQQTPKTSTTILNESF